MQQVNIVLVDDLDGSVLEDGETVTFAIDGTSYEIDLSRKNGDKLRKALTPYIEVARKVSKSGGGRKASTGPKRDTTAIKAWADAQGLDYPKRGRLPQSLIDMFEAAN